MLPVKRQTVHVTQDENGHKVKQFWLKTEQSKAEFLQAMQDGISFDLPDPVKPPTSTTNELCAILPLADCHFGLLADRAESGKRWTLDKGIDAVQRAAGNLIDKAEPSKHCLIANLGDFLHFETRAPKTQGGGNILDASDRANSIIEKATALLRWIIDSALAKFGHVTVANLRGNHDDICALWLYQLCKAWYEKEPRVTILDSAPKLQVWQWKKNLIPMHHGDGIKPQDMHNAVTRDHRKAYGKANYTLGLLGHVHHKHAQEVAGCDYEVISTMTPTDAWHSDKLYGSQRRMPLIQLHKNGGIAACHYEYPIR